VLVLDDVNLIALAVKKIKEERVKKCFAKAGFGESDVVGNLEEASENIAAISNLCGGKEFSCDKKNFVQNDDHLATHYTSSFESATALLAVRNTQNEDVENEEEEEKEGGEETTGEQDISTKIRTHEQALHCVSEVMQFAIDSNSSSILELLYTVKACIKKDMIAKEVETSFFVESVEEIGNV
jgi:hypothetical protein